MSYQHLKTDFYSPKIFTNGFDQTVVYDFPNGLLKGYFFTIPSNEPIDLMKLSAFRSVQWCE